MIEERMAKIKEFSDFSEIHRVSIWANFTHAKIFDELLPTAQFSLLQEKTNGEIESTNALFNTLINHVQEMQTKLQSNILAKLRKSHDKDEAMIRELREEIAELQRKHSELEMLSQNEDHLQLLQASQWRQ